MLDLYVYLIEIVDKDAVHVRTKLKTLKIFYLHTYELTIQGKNSN